MRNEAEMIQVILEVAQQLPQVEAVALSGSRGNPDAPVDIFQDYDVIYLVSELTPLLKDRSWLKNFGEQLIMQTPEEMSLFPPELGSRFTFLMLFKDGVRVDLMLCPVADKDLLLEDPFVVPLHDPQGLLSDFPAPSDTLFWVTPPSRAEFSDCCNQFWWVSTYVVKGLWRNELFYATDHLYESCQKELLRLLSWQVGATHDFKVSVGKNYKYLPDYLEEGTIMSLNELRDFSSRQQIWRSLFATQSLFHEHARQLADQLGFDYDETVADQVMDYSFTWQKNQLESEK